MAPNEDESLIERIGRLIAEAVDRGDHNSEADVLEKAGMSSGWLSERRGKAALAIEAGKLPPGIRASTAARLAETLGVSLGELLGESVPAPDDDEDVERSWAVRAARDLQLSELAIRTVQAEPPGLGDRRYWFHRILAEAERVPATGSRGKG